jgi:TonB family protein
LSAARELYAGAAYEEALVVLNRLRSTAPQSEESSAIEQYRAFCLLALGRAADAEQAIEAVVEAQPLFQPSNTEVSPRLRSAFSEVRRRKLPAIVLQKYATAKAAYDRKSWVEAESGFKQVLAVLSDPDVAVAASQPPLSDMKVLATGFHDLSAAAAAPPPPPPPVAAAPPPPPAPTAIAGRIYVAGDPGVVAPVPIRQTLPPFPAQNPAAAMPRDGSLEVVIDERGAVEAAMMRVSLNPAYDRQVILATRNWEFRPATINGVPVKYRKTVQINVKR